MLIYGDRQSGNCYKILLLLHLLQRPYQWRPIDVLAGDTRSQEFLALNPNGKIPLLQLDDRSTLAESNAILNFLAEGTPFLPVAPFARAKVLQWQFFEQYSHEPYIAVARFIAKYLGLPESRLAEFQSKQKGGHRALAVMEHQLQQTPYLVGESITIADISLYGYTHVAEEGGFALDDYPAIRAWLQRIASHPHYVAMDDAHAPARPT
ncbi:glutathione S-transferase family protein [Pseudomarimonas arenosa]|uniref:Glutathione S-transferase family protein n=1 Tax=Pseudomarimonas arenosa TaxID=2774145 RepID=A0AAW3ZQN8_9GAMM|nr:glutathione S-transferase family protein [Pseudomarimonas arenosa]MBD8527855.1 glutathione S-transferase family protein [Pseudomarimonas arenosa]